MSFRERWTKKLAESLTKHEERVDVLEKVQNKKVKR